MKKFEILTLLYKEKDYKKAESLCINNNKYFDLLAMCLFKQNRFSEAAEIFRKLEKFAEEGYCYFYSGNKEYADKIWFSKEDNSSLLNWAKAFSCYVERRKLRLPTFFEIRNFYEPDLDMLISLGFEEYAENIINSIQYFGYINLEVYKFTARVLYNHGYYDFADKFLYVAKEYGDEDTELYVIDAQNNIAQNRYYAAVKSLEKALDISPDYMPAKILSEKLKRCC